MVAYALWAAGGPLGLHHLYLGRDSHALLWMLTLGGFGFGWVREFLRIPAYVGEANQDAEKGRKRPPTMTPPPVGPVRFAGQVCVGIYFGTVALIGLNSLNFFYLIVLPLCVGAGVHLVSSVGQQTSDLQKTMTTCLITSSLFYGSTLSPLPISLAASVTATQHRKFKPPQRLESKQELGEVISQIWQYLHSITLQSVSLKQHVFLSFAQVRGFSGSVWPGLPSLLRWVTVFSITPQPHCTTCQTVWQLCWISSGSCLGSGVWSSTFF